jgi:hypothetical protein
LIWARRLKEKMGFDWKRGLRARRSKERKRKRGLIERGLRARRSKERKRKRGLIGKRAKG